jgi:hypothetical protein
MTLRNSRLMASAVSYHFERMGKARTEQIVEAAVIPGNSRGVQAGRIFPIRTSSENFCGSLSHTMNAKVLPSSVLCATEQWFSEHPVALYCLMKYILFGAFDSLYAWSLQDREK